MCCFTLPLTAIHVFCAKCRLGLTAAPFFFSPLFRTCMQKALWQAGGAKHDLEIDQVIYGGALLFPHLSYQPGTADHYFFQKC